jgi:hypothetical protein
VFEGSTRGSQLVGEVGVKDRAIGDDVELGLPASPAVQVATTRLSQNNKSANYRLRLSNANPYPISAEIKLPATMRNLPDSVRKKDGRPIWYVTIPANDSSELTIDVPFQ